MYVMMPVNVVSKACEHCSRFKVVVQKDYAAGSGTPTEINLECANYDDCLNALDMWQRGQAGKEANAGK